MSKKFRFKKGWKRWNAGDEIDEFEYKRLPHEIKNSIMEEVVSEIKVPKIKNIMSGIVADLFESYDPKAKPVETDNKELDFPVKKSPSPFKRKDDLTTNF